MSKRLLILNVDVSGMNKYLFHQLKEHGWNLLVVDIPFPKLCRYWSLISTFSVNVQRWKEKHDQKINKLHKTAWAFRRRSLYAAKVLQRHKGRYDAILQISGGFAPFDPLKSDKAVKYYALISYTMKLSQGFEGWEPYKHEFDKWVVMEKALYKHATKVLTTNENVRQSLMADYGIKPENVIKIGYGLTLKDLPQDKKTYDGKTLLFIGMDFQRKGGYVLLDAFKKVRKSIADARLLIVGPNKELLKIDQPGVEMLGHIKDKQKVAALYQEASVFVMPSLMEPFGLVFLEAMAHKLPCIGTTVDAMPEIIEDGKTGFTVRPNDACQLAGRIKELLMDTASLQKMGEAAFQRGINEFSWEKVGRSLDSELTYFKEKKNGVHKRRN